MKEATKIIRKNWFNEECTRTVEKGKKAKAIMKRKKLRRVWKQL